MDGTLVEDFLGLLGWSGTDWRAEEGWTGTLSARAT